MLNVQFRLDGWLVAFSSGSLLRFTFGVYCFGWIFVSIALLSWPRISLFSLVPFIIETSSKAFVLLVIFALPIVLVWLNTILRIIQTRNESNFSSQHIEQAALYLSIRFFSLFLSHLTCALCMCLCRLFLISLIFFFFSVFHLFRSVFSPLPDHRLYLVLCGLHFGIADHFGCSYNCFCCLFALFFIQFATRLN